MIEDEPITDILAFTKQDTTTKKITDNVKNLLNCPITDDVAFVTIRELFILHENYYIVRLTEISPVPCRIWVNVYNWDNWSGWKQVVPE